MRMTHAIGMSRIRSRGVSGSLGGFGRIPTPTPIFSPEGQVSAFRTFSENNEYVAQPSPVLKRRFHEMRDWVKD